MQVDDKSGNPKVNSEIRWDEKTGLRRDSVGSQVIDVLEAQEIKETGNEERGVRSKIYEKDACYMAAGQPRRSFQRTFEREQRLSSVRSQGRAELKELLRRFGVHNCTVSCFGRMQHFVDLGSHNEAYGQLQCE